jgi:hypothetical protein
LIAISEYHDRRLKREMEIVRKKSEDTIKSLDARARELSSAPSSGGSGTRCFGEGGSKWRCY